MTKRPGVLKVVQALAKWNIRRSVNDLELRRKLTPRYRIGCKRILNSSTYYQAFANPKTELVTDCITQMTPDGTVGSRSPTWPNLFLLLGPNTGLGHKLGGVHDRVADPLCRGCHRGDRQGRHAGVAPTRAAQDAFNAELQEKLGHSVWITGGCSSWYLDAHGNNRVLWGGYTWQYWLGTRRVKPSEYRFFALAHHDAVA